MENKNVTLEQIDLIMERAKVSYTNAKDALERSNGNVLEAIILLEKEEKVKADDSMSQIKGTVNKMAAKKFVMRKKDECYVNVPVPVALAIGIFTLPIFITVVVLSMVFGIKVEIVGEKKSMEPLSPILKK